MPDYKSLGHSARDILETARKEIQAVPRPDSAKERQDIKNIARPDDDRKGEIPTRQQEIQKKIIDEQDDQPEVEDPDEKECECKDKKKDKKGKTKVEINPEIDNNIFASKEEKGELVEIKKTTVSLNLDAIVKQLHIQRL